MSFKKICLGAAIYQLRCSSIAVITAGGYFEISQGRNIVKGPDGLGWFFEAGLCRGTL